MVALNAKEMKKVVAGPLARAENVIDVKPEEVVGNTNYSRWNAERDTAATYGHDDATIDGMVEDFHRRGQIHNVTARLLDDGSLELVEGFLRWQAMLAHNGKYPETPLRLRVNVVKMTDEEVAEHNITENRKRKDTSPMDDAQAQQTLREKFGWKDKKVAEFYGHDPAHVCRLKRLVDPERPLRPAVAKMIHARMIPIQLAYELASLDTKAQDAIIKRVKAEAKEDLKRWKELDKRFDGLDGEADDKAPEAADSAPSELEGVPSKTKKRKTAAQVVAEGVGEEKRKKRETNGASSNGRHDKKRRDLVAVRAFFEGLNSDDKEEPNVKALSAHTIDFINGVTSEVQYEKHLRNYVTSVERKAE